MHQSHTEFFKITNSYIQPYNVELVTKYYISLILKFTGMSTDSQLLSLALEEQGCTNSKPSSSSSFSMAATWSVLIHPVLRKLCHISHRVIFPVLSSRPSSLAKLLSRFSSIALFQPGLVGLYPSRIYSCSRLIIEGKQIHYHLYLILSQTCSLLSSSISPSLKRRLIGKGLFEKARHMQCWQFQRPGRMFLGPLHSFHISRCHWSTY